MATKKTAATAKTSVAKRSVNRGSVNKSAGDAFSNQDAKRRLGNFTTAGEHARVGGRTSGIVGQTTKRNKTDHGGAKRATRKAAK